MPTISGFSPVFSTPIEQAKANCERRLDPPSSPKTYMTTKGSRQLVTFIHCTLSAHLSAVGATINRVADALQLQLLKGAQQYSWGAWKEGNHTSDPDQIWLKEKEAAKLESRCGPLTHPREPQSRTCQDIQHPINLQEKHPCFHQHMAKRQT